MDKKNKQKKLKPFHNHIYYIYKIFHENLMNITCDSHQVKSSHQKLHCFFMGNIFGLQMKISTSYAVHKRIIESLSRRGTHPVLSLYKGCLQHRNTWWIEPNMKTIILCVLLSLAVTVYCKALPEDAVQDETFAEVCMCDLSFYPCMYEFT